MRTLLLATLLALPLAAAAAGGSSDTPNPVLAVIDQSFAHAADTVADAPLSDANKTSVSNVLKTKHDTVKNSINNIR